MGKFLKKGPKRIITYYNMEFITIYNWPKLGSNFFITIWRLFLYKVLLNRGFTVVCCNTGYQNRVIRILRYEYMIPCTCNLIQYFRCIKSGIVSIACVGYDL